MIVKKLSKYVGELFPHTDDKSILSADYIRKRFHGSGKGRSVVKCEIMAAVFRHFDWYIGLILNNSNE